MQQCKYTPTVAHKPNRTVSYETVSIQTLIARITFTERLAFASKNLPLNLLFKDSDSWHADKKSEWNVGLWIVEFFTKQWFVKHQ